MNPSGCPSDMSIMSSMNTSDAKPICIPDSPSNNSTSLSSRVSSCSAREEYRNYGERIIILIQCTDYPIGISTCNKSFIELFTVPLSSCLYCHSVSVFINVSNDSRLSCLCHAVGECNVIILLECQHVHICSTGSESCRDA